MPISRYTVLCILALGAGLGSTAQAQSLCDLLTAAELATTVGITANFTARPNTEGGNGCDYKGAGGGPTLGVADTSTDSGMFKIIANARFKTLGPNDERIAGIGTDALYSFQQVSYPQFTPSQYVQQWIVIRAKGKYVTFALTTPGNKGVPKASMLALARLTVSKPIDTLKDPN